MSKGLIFISYRRADEGSATRFLKAELEEFFGIDQIFMDVDGIRGADNWPTKITENLMKSTVLICVIGKNWLSLHDEYYKRRIDNTNDWVRNEIETSISRKITIIPLLLGASLPTKAALPESLQVLTDIQTHSLTASHWRNDLQELKKILIESGIEKRRESIFPYPKFTADEKKEMRFPLPLTSAELENEISNLTNWKVLEFPFQDQTPEHGRVIEKEYKFKSFKDAIDFISITSSHIDKINHHPEWCNTWKTLRMRLSSWDIEHKLSYLDIELAKYLDSEFKKYEDKIHSE